MGPNTLSLIAAAAVATSTANCVAIEGAKTVLADKNLSFVIIGELHGTTETPAIFADLVCLAAKKRGKVIVGVEFPVSDQPAIDAFMTSNDLKAARLCSFRIGQLCGCNAIHEIC